MKNNVTTAHKVGTDRNDLCPCGSKKKYKKCCGRNNIKGGCPNNVVIIPIPKPKPVANYPTYTRQALTRAFHIDRRGI